MEGMETAEEQGQTGKSPTLMKAPHPHTLTSVAATYGMSGVARASARNAYSESTVAAAKAKRQADRPVKKAAEDAQKAATKAAQKAAEAEKADKAAKTAREQDTAGSAVFGKKARTSDSST